MADDTAHVIHAWVIDGVSTIFVTDEALDSTWAVAQGFVDTRPGLEPPDGLTAAVNLRQLWPDDTSARIKVNDMPATMAALFAANRHTADDLVTTLEPGVTAGASLYSKHVGLEAIGPAGERRRYSCVPAFAVGLRHLGQNEAFANDVGPAPVSDGPVLWDGRRCCVYRVKYVAGAWQTLAAAKRVWWGTMRGKGQQKLSSWSFQCHGPHSWASGTLGTGNFQEGLRVVPLLSLEANGFDGDMVMRATLMVRKITFDKEIKHTYCELLTDTDNYLVGANTYALVAAAVNSFLTDVESSTQQSADTFDKYGNGLLFNTQPGSDGIEITWYRGETTGSGDPKIDNTDALSFTAVLVLGFSEKVWRALGYDPVLQNPPLEPLENEDQFGFFTKSNVPSRNYSGVFYAANAKAMQAWVDGEAENGDIFSSDWSNGGGPRRWPPIWSLGAVAFAAEPGQEFQLQTNDEIRLSPSKSRPLMADPDDNTSAFTLGGSVGDVTAQGLLVLEGPIRRRGDGDQAEPAAGFAFELSRERREGRTVQVARVCWREASGLIATDSDGYPRLVVHEWLEPGLYGFDYPIFSGIWGAFRIAPENAEPIRARPLSVWEYSAQGDKITTVVQRIMATTGTAGGWFEDAGLTTPLYGLGGDTAYLSLGANDTGAVVPTDAEAASYGLAIPASMIQDPADFDTAALDVGQHLVRCKAAVFGSASSRLLLARLLAPTGMAIGYSGGKFGVFDPWRFPTPEDSVLTITTELYAGRPGAPGADVMPSQDLRQYAPIDRLAINARVEPLDGSYLVKTSRNSSDFGAAYRGQDIVHTIAGDHMVSPRVPVTGNSWSNDIPIRWRQGFEFWASRHTLVNIKLHVEDAIDVWPQDGVLITDSSLLDTVGAYGVSVAAARVLSRTYNASKQTMDMRIMVAAETDYRMYAPSAVVTQYDETDPFVLECADDHFGDRGGDTFDVDGFAEPTWSTEGGSASVQVFQFDGSTWSGGIYGTVSSVTGATSNSSITLTGALTGATWHSDRHSIVVLREFGNQAAAWVKRWYAPITESDGTHDPASTVGSKWRQV